MNENNNPNINQNLNSTETPMPTTPNYMPNMSSLNQTNGSNSTVTQVDNSIPTRSAYHQSLEPQNMANQYPNGASFSEPTPINNQGVSAIPEFTPNSNPTSSMNTFSSPQKENNNPFEQQASSNGMNNFTGGFNNNLPPVTNNINQDEPDDTFTEPKKKSAAPVIIIILLLLILGGGAYYYFIFDNPGKIFTSYTEKLLSPLTNIKDHDKFNSTYSVDYSLITADETVAPLYELLSKFTFSGSIGYEKNTNEGSVIFNSTYDGKSLPSIQMMLDMKDGGTSYLYAKDLYDKPIKGTTDSTSESNTESIDISVADYKELFTSITEVATDTLSSANYTKTYIKLDGTYVKKITLNLDKATTEKFYKGLLNSDKFMSSYAKITSSTEAEIADSINEEIANLKDVVEELSLYVGIINNEFIMLEDNGGADGELKITKKNNTYSFEYSENYTLTYQGDITINNSSANDTSISLNLDLLDEKTTVKLNFSYKTDYTKGLDTFDTTNAVESSSISEEDTMNIMEKLLKNDAISKFLTDSGLDNYLSGGLTSEA